MTVNYILSQIFVVISYVFLGLTYIVKKRVATIFMNFIALIAGLIGFLFLSAWSGLATVVFSIFRTGVLLLQEKFFKSKDGKYNTFDFLTLFVFTSVMALLSYITYNGLPSLLPCIAGYLFTISIWQKNKLTFYILGVIVEICWTVYNFYLNSLMGEILEPILFVVVLSQLTIYMFKDKINFRKLKKTK